MELDRTRDALQVARNEFNHHEGFFRGVVLAPDAESRRGLKPEAGVVGRVAENHDRAETETLAAFQTRADKR